MGLILFGAEEIVENNSILYIREMAKPDLEFVRNIMEMKNHEAPENSVGGVNFSFKPKRIYLKCQIKLL